MEIRIVTVGKIKEKYLCDGIAEYAKRLSRYCNRAAAPLRTDESRGIYGPGHNSFTEDEEGNPIMVYHARTEAEIEGNPLYNPNRHAMLMKIRWDEKTGAPIFSYED